MGNQQDMDDRISLVRVDDLKCRCRVEAVHKAIYVDNCAVDGAVVETLLKEDSLVPATVGSLIACM
jgi:hypothetical protein